MNKHKRWSKKWSIWRATRKLWARRKPQNIYTEWPHEGRKLLGQ